MRFAGSEPVTNYLKGGLNMGAAAQAGAKTRSAIKNAATQLEGQVGASGISAAGQVEAAGIVGAAQASAANSQAMGSALSSLGGIASSAIGSFGGGGGGSTFAPSLKSNLSAGASSWNSMSSFVGNNPYGL